LRGCGFGREWASEEIVARSYLDFRIDLGDPKTVAVYDELALWSAMFGLLMLKYLPLRPDLHGPRRRLWGGLSAARAGGEIGPSIDDLRDRSLEGGGPASRPEGEELERSECAIARRGREADLNRVAHRRGEFFLTVPMAYVEARKTR
jgi:hypothetical protein